MQKRRTSRAGQVFSSGPLGRPRQPWARGCWKWRVGQGSVGRCGTLTDQNAGTSATLWLPITRLSQAKWLGGVHKRESV